MAFSLACAPGAEGVTSPVPPADTTSAYYPGTAWRTAQPASVGLDANAVAALVSSTRSGNSVPGIHGLLILRHGYLVVEEYYAGNSALTVHTLQSISKSVTSLLVGIAQDHNQLASINSQLLDFFPEYTLANVDDRKRAVRVRDALTMRSGISFWENPYEGSPLQQLNNCTCDWLKLVLDRPMDAAPDATWAYNSGTAIVLGGVIRAATKMAADDYAQQMLFSPLGISSWTWFRGEPNGLPHMGGGLSLRATDLARIGYLVLRNGMWNGTRIVSESWLRESTARITSPTPTFFYPYATDYGMLWWLVPRNGKTGVQSEDDYIVTASGSGGQWLFIDRKKNLVVVINGALGSSNGPGIQLMLEKIEAAVK